MSTIKQMLSGTVKKGHLIGENFVEEKWQNLG